MRSRKIKEPIPSLVRLVADALAAAGLRTGRPCSARRLKEAEAALAASLAPSWRAFLQLHDGAELPDGRVLSLDEALSARAFAPKGLVPVVQAHGAMLHLDMAYPDGLGDWPVVEFLGNHTEPAGTGFLRFVLAYLAPDAAARAEADPEHGDHWLDWAGELDEKGDREGAAQVVRRGLLAANPVGAALLLAMGEHEIAAGRRPSAAAYFDAAMVAELYSTRDEGARYDAAAQRLALAREDGDEAAVARCLDALGEGVAATAGLWIEESLRALGRGREEWARHAARVVLALEPEDRDAPKLAEPTPQVREAAELAVLARDRMPQDERGDASETRRLLERAQTRATLGVVLLQFARLEAVEGGRRAVEIARRAVHANPALLDGHFQLGDAYLTVGEHASAEKTLRHVVERDPSFGLAWSKLALSLLSQGRVTEAIECAERGLTRSEDVFFSYSVYGDCLVEAQRFEDAARAYEEALGVYDGDHWTLHQAANAYVEVGDYPRAAELFEKAIERDPDRCHQTLADYAYLKRRMGRIGEAVGLYKRAVKMAPGEPAYRDLLREAQKDLAEAPN